MGYVEGGMVSEAVSRITRQYQGAVGQLNIMFDTARVRTAREAWRKDQVGSCAQISSKERSELGLCGPAKEHLISLRERRSQTAGGKSELTGWPIP